MRKGLKGIFVKNFIASCIVIQFTPVSPWRFDFLQRVEEEVDGDA
jgi:hypothetical protein